MKRYTILSLFFLTFVLPIFAAVGETFTNSDAKYANLVFTVLDEDAKTVSVKAANIALFTADDVLDIPSSVMHPSSGQTYTVTKIEKNGFYDTSSEKGIKIQKVVIPSSVKSIEDQALRNIKTPFTLVLNEGLQEIGNRAFCKCESLLGVVIIPSTVTTISEAAFFQCSKIDTIELKGTTPPQIRTDKLDAFFSVNAIFLIPCNSILNYSSNEYWSTKDLTDPCAFYTIDGLLYKIASQTDVKIVGYKTINSSLNIPSTVIIENKQYTVTEIADEVFKDNTTITMVDVPSTIKAIGNSAFLNCKNLATLTLHEGLESIGRYAFAHDSMLISLEFPSTLRTLGYAAFKFCINLEKITLNEGLIVISDSCFTQTRIDTLRTPSSLETIGLYAFRDNSNMKRVILNEGLLKISSRAFTKNYNLTDTLIIPSTVTSIGSAAFHSCSKIKRIEMLPYEAPMTKIVSISDSIFYGNNTANIVIPCGAMDNYTTANYWKDLSGRFVTACEPLVLSPKTTLEQDTIVSSIAYRRTFDMDVWQTLYLPFEVDSVLVEEIWEGKPYYYDINKPYDSQKGGYFYLNNYKEASAEDETITFTPATTLEGNTPYLIQFPQISSDGYFAGKNIIFKSKTGEHILKKSDYTQPKASNLFQISGNSSVYNQDVSKMYIFAATAVKDDQGNPIKTSDGRDSIKYEFNQQTSTTLKPFDFGLLPYEVKPSSGASLLPTRMSLRISRGSGNTGGGNITTSIADSEAAYAITYRVNANNLLLHQNGHPCQLYSISGTLLYTSAEGTEEVTIPLEKGIYILYCEGQSQKIVL